MTLESFGNNIVVE